MSDDYTSEPFEMAALLPSGPATGMATLGRVGYDWTLTFTLDGRSYVGTAGDVFEASRVLRRTLDADGILLGCNAARPNVWASGMQRDMASGRFIYLLDLEPPQATELPTLAALDPAPLDEVGTVAQQDEYQTRWWALRA